VLDEAHPLEDLRPLQAPLDDVEAESQHPAIVKSVGGDRATRTLATARDPGAWLTNGQYSWPAFLESGASRAPHACVAHA
jgi:hypothetical protein